MSTINLIATPDGNYEMIYVDGKLEASSDIIYSFEWAKVIKKYIPIEKIEYWELTFNACDKYEYNFPESIEQYKPDDYKIK